MWVYHSSIGLLKIVRMDDGLCYFMFGDDPTPWSGHPDPQVVADDVFCHATGCPDWDNSDITGPADLSMWVRA